MLRIKSTVSLELRELESRRQKLQTDISIYNQKIDEIKQDLMRQQTELDRLKISVEQAQVAEREAVQRNTPELARKYLLTFQGEVKAVKNNNTDSEKELDEETTMKKIFIFGFGLYGSSTGAADYNVKIDLKRLGCVLAENNTKFFSDGSSNTFQIESDCFYTASVILDGTELSFFGQEGMTEVCMGNVTLYI